MEVCVTFWTRTVKAMQLDLAFLGCHPRNRQIPLLGILLVPSDPLRSLCYRGYMGAHGDGLPYLPNQGHQGEYTMLGV